jgi:hypothetical protein
MHKKTYQGGASICVTLAIIFQRKGTQQDRAWGQVLPPKTSIKMQIKRNTIRVGLNN